MSVNRSHVLGFLGREGGMGALEPGLFLSGSPRCSAGGNEMVITQARADRSGAITYPPMKLISCFIVLSYQWDLGDDRTPPYPECSPATEHTENDTAGCGGAQNPTEGMRV